MTTAEFEHWIKQGLGRAVTRLRAEEDKSPFYDIVLRAATTNYYRNYYPAFYIYDLIRSFDNGSGLEAAVVAASTAYYNNGAYIGYCDSAALLRMFYTDGNDSAGEKLEQIYKDIYAELENCDGAADYIVHEKLTAYLIISPNLAAVRGENCLRHIFYDIESLYSRGKIPQRMLELYTFFSLVRNLTGDMFERALKTIRAETGKELMLDKFIKMRAESRFAADDNGCEMPHVPFIEIYQSIKNGENVFQQLFIEAKTYTREQHVILANLVFDESDISKKQQILNIFTQQDVTWPIDELLLINLLRSYEYVYSMKNYRGHEYELRLTVTLIEILGGLRSEAVHDYALELIGRNYLNLGVALWVKNIQTGERERFNTVIHQIDTDCDYYFRQVFLKICEENELDSPNDLILFMYENTGDNYYRYRFITELKRRGAVSDGLAEECRYDISKAIRDLF